MGQSCAGSCQVTVCRADERRVVRVARLDIIINYAQSGHGEPAWIPFVRSIDGMAGEVGTDHATVHQSAHTEARLTATNTGDHAMGWYIETPTG